MAISEDYLQYIQDQLSFDEFHFRKMFGGVGIFVDGVMFGMISSKNEFRLKVDDSNRADYESRGMGPLTMKNKGKSMPYYLVPEDIVEDPEMLKQWVKKSIDLAIKAKK